MMFANLSSTSAWLGLLVSILAIAGIAGGAWVFRSGTSKGLVELWKGTADGLDERVKFLESEKGRMSTVIATQEKEITRLQEQIITLQGVITAKDSIDALGVKVEKGFSAVLEAIHR